MTKAYAIKVIQFDGTVKYAVGDKLHGNMDLADVYMDYSLAELYRASWGRDYRAARAELVEIDMESDWNKLLLEGKD